MKVARGSREAARGTSIVADTGHARQTALPSFLPNALLGATTVAGPSGKLEAPTARLPLYFRPGMGSASPHGCPEYLLNTPLHRTPAP